MKDIAHLTARHMYLHSSVLSLQERSELITKCRIYNQSEITEDLKRYESEACELKRPTPPQPPLLSSGNKRKMGQLTLCTASVVFMENNLLLSLVSRSCYLPGDLINRVHQSVGIRELASDSELLEGHISFFMLHLEIWNANNVGSPKQITSLVSNLIPNLLFDDKCFFKS